MNLQSEALKAYYALFGKLDERNGALWGVDIGVKGPDTAPFIIYELFIGRPIHEKCGFGALTLNKGASEPSRPGLIRKT